VAHPLTIDAVDLFYLSMPQVRDVGDGSQDALLVRVQAGKHVGWGECEASPLVSIASFVCPMSHSACKPVRDSVLGQRLAGVDDIRRIGNLVRENSLDLLQADHTLSGIDMALWDLWGKVVDEPVYRLLGYATAYAKTPYASMLFGDDPQETLVKGRKVRELGYRAAKFGWGPFGKGSSDVDRDHLMAAREGLGPDAILLVDVGTVWGDDVESALLRLPALEESGARWLEEPFVSGALNAYRTLAERSPMVKMAGGEGAHNFYMAQQMIDYAGLGYIQIDAGRIGGITIAKQVADYAAARGVTYVNHTFTTHLALSASIQPYAGLADHVICEYPVEASSLAMELTKEHLLPDQNGEIHLLDRPGLGLEPDPEAIRRYLVDVEIRVQGKVYYRTPG
jgi:L-alanine-DL-glutamate epimerase-like enolase superfamily enzyme